MLNVGSLLFFISFLSLLLKLTLSQYVDSNEVELEYIDGSATYIYDFIIFICYICYFRYIDKVFKPIVFSFVVVLPTFVLASYLNLDNVISGIATVLRWFLPFFLLAHYASYLRRHPEYYSILCNVLTFLMLLCFLYGFWNFPMATNRFDGDNEGLWWPAYFGNLHTTCYVAASVFFLQYVRFSYGEIQNGTSILFFIVAFAIVTFGWGVRTVALLLLIFAYSVLHVKYLGKISIYKYFSVFLSAVAAAVWYVFYFDWDYYSRVTSGRLSMYQAKMDQLSENGIVQWVIGNGAGSDIIETSFWWGAKGAHSDLITTLVEGGLLFCFIFLFFHFYLYRILQNTNARYIVLPVLFSGLVSNGYLSRPIAMYVLMMSFAGFYALSIRAKGMRKNNDVKE